MDFVTGIAEVEAHEAGLVLKEPASRYERYVKLAMKFGKRAVILTQPPGSWTGCGKPGVL